MRTPHLCAARVSRDNTRTTTTDRSSLFGPLFSLVPQKEPLQFLATNKKIARDHIPVRAETKALLLLCSSSGARRVDMAASAKERYLCVGGSTDRCERSFCSASCCSVGAPSPATRKRERPVSTWTATPAYPPEATGAHTRACQVSNDIVPNCAQNKCHSICYYAYSVKCAPQLGPFSQGFKSATERYRRLFLQVRNLYRQVQRRQPVRST